MAFDSNQPRDESGKWTAGGGNFQKLGSGEAFDHGQLVKGGIEVFVDKEAKLHWHAPATGKSGGPHTHVGGLILDAQDHSGLAVPDQPFGKDVTDKIKSRSLRYSPDQDRDDHGRFSSGGGAGGGDAKAKFVKFAKTAALTVAALALKHYGWQMLPAWATKIAKKSLRSAVDMPEHSPQNIDELLKALSPEQVTDLIKHLDDNLSEEQKTRLVSLLEDDDNQARSGDPRMSTERRSYRSDKLAIDKADGKQLRLAGHAAVFNLMSEDLGGFRELIQPGAFVDVLKGDTRALFNHDPNFVLGRSTSKTLRLAEDERGLSFEIDMPDTQTVRDLVITPIERGDITQMSFGFRAKQEGQKWSRHADGYTLRTITKFSDLFDVSPVTFPGYAQTDVALRSLRAFQASELPRTPYNLLRALEQQAQI